MWYVCIVMWYVCIRPFTGDKFLLNIFRTKRETNIIIDRVQTNIKNSSLGTSNHVRSLVISIMYPRIGSVFHPFNHWHGFMVGA